MILIRFLIVSVSLCASLPCLAATAEKASAENSKAVPTRVFVQPVKCQFPDCSARDQHGDVALVYAAGNKTTLTNQGNALDTKLSGNGTVGWTAGKHAKAQSGTVFANDQLVLWRNGRIVARMKSDKPFIEEWQFVNDGTQVVVKSRAAHGVASVELFDVASGQRKEKLAAFEINDQSPTWARPFRED